MSQGYFSFTKLRPSFQLQIGWSSETIPEDNANDQENKFCNDRVCIVPFPESLLWNAHSASASITTLFDSYSETQTGQGPLFKFIILIFLFTLIAVNF